MTRFCLTPLLAFPFLLQATPDTLFLTWDTDPARTMSVQWLTPGTELPVASGAESPDDPAAHLRDIPPVEGIVADGELSDWPSHARRVALFAEPDEPGASEKDLAAELRLGWMGDALAVAVVVRDDHLVPSPSSSSPWAGDSVELFFGEPGKTHLQIVTGRADGALRIADKRASRDAAVELKPARATDAAGNHVLEVLLPLAALGVEPRAGAEFRFQAIINDLDPDRPRRRHAWFPDLDSDSDPNAFHAVRLVNERHPAHEDLRAVAGLSSVKVVARAGRAGEEIEVRAGARRLASARLVAEGELARATIELPAPESGRQWGRLRVGSASRADERFPVDPHIAARTRAPDPVELRYWRDDEDESAARVARSVPRGFGKNKGVHVQRVRLEGLAPDTRYRFRVGAATGTETFLTAPATLDAPLVFAEGGDVGVGPVVPKLHRLASSWSPRFAVVGGDLAYADAMRIDRWWHYLRDWHAHMRTPAGDLVPMLVCIGNHEVRGGYGARGAAPFFYALFDGLYPKTGYAALDFGDWLSFLFLDTAHTTPIPGAQAEWLREALAERRHVLHRFTVWHVPAWPSTRAFDNRWSREVRENWVPIVEADRPSLAFEHHDHTYKRTRRLLGGEEHPDGVVYVGDGNWGVGSRPAYAERPYLEKAKSTFNVLRVTIRPDGTGEVLVVDEAGAEVDAFSFARPARR